jgi:hypothetical protein
LNADLLLVYVSPDIMPTNRFVLQIANNYYHKVTLTASLPVSWFIRWDAPSEANVAILDIFVSQMYVINVYKASSASGPFTYIPNSLTIPTLNSAAGANSYNPQGRNLTLAVRGGNQNVYKFIVTPTIAVTVRMDMSFSDFFSNTFVANIATMLGIPSSRIIIASVRAGSVIVEFAILPDTTTSANLSPTEILQQSAIQIASLRSLADNFTSFANNGVLSSALNVSILSVSILPPGVSTFSPTDQPSPPSEVPSASPSMPTFEPSQTPSAPSVNPSSTPSAPTFSPTVQPTGNLGLTEPSVAPSGATSRVSSSSGPKINETDKIIIGVVVGFVGCFILVAYILLRSVTRRSVKPNVDAFINKDRRGTYLDFKKSEIVKHNDDIAFL